MERETKIFFVKAVLSDDNTLSGVGAVSGNMDRRQDVIYPGAWSKRGLLSSFVKNGFVPDTHEWNWEKMVGYPTSAKEVGNELQYNAAFHTTPFAQNVRTIIAERIAAGKSVGLSVGFLPDYEDGVHHFGSGADLMAHAKGMGCDMDLFDKSIGNYKGYCRGLSQMKELYEISPVPAPMNPAAHVTDVKADMKSVCGAADLPLAERDHAWDAGAARKRLKGDDDAPSAQYRRAHMVCVGPTDEFTSYKLPFGDLIDGKLTAVPRAVFAIAEVLQGSRGGVHMPDEDKAAVKSRVAAYYAKMRSKFGDEEIEVPWQDDDSDKSYRPLSIETATAREFEAFLRDAGCSRKQATAITLHGFNGLQRDADERDEPTPASVPAIDAHPQSPQPVLSPDQPPRVAEIGFAELARRMALLRAFAPPQEAYHDAQGASGTV